MFELFDPRDEYVVRYGSLPHWYQQGVTYFVTFRTEDSVPQSLARDWHGRRDKWLRSHGLAPLRDWKKSLGASPELEREYHKMFTRPFMAYLDRGLGACLLSDPKVAQIIADTLLHFDRNRYTLSDFVVMPNHVHLLVGLLGTTRIESQCTSWKKYSAGKINRLVGRVGRFWQEESFDHLVRSPEQFAYLKRYIAQNPEHARLQAGQYLHWVRAEVQLAHSVCRNCPGADTPPPILTA